MIDNPFVMAVGATVAIFGFYTTVVYPDLEYKGGERNSACYGECYEEYVKQFGTPAEMERRKKELAAGDPFSSIRSLWGGCAACHGQNGEGVALFPKLAGQSKEYIVGRLNTYKNRGEVGSMSSTMWGQAAMLTQEEIETIGDFIEQGVPAK
tara:strand:- start:365 stop:820 length:456 start_codon:yes stop_codon:yes gene_type:complete